MKKLLFLFLFPSWVSAHPHEWIELQITPQTNAQGQLTAMKEYWVFDPYTAEMLLEPIFAIDNIAGQKAAFADFSRETDKNLAQQNYFTYSDAAFLPVKDGTLQVNSAGDLVFSFTLVLKTPVNRLHYQVYESSYFIEIRHAENQQTVWDNGCQLHITESEPDEQDYELAASLDRGVQAPATLGALFAQQAELLCKPK